MATTTKIVTVIFNITLDRYFCYDGDGVNADQVKWTKSPLVADKYWDFTALDKRHLKPTVKHLKKKFPTHRFAVVTYRVERVTKVSWDIDKFKPV